MNHKGIYFNGHRRDVGMEPSPAVLVARLIGMWNTLKLAILLASEKRDVPHPGMLFLLNRMPWIQKEIMVLSAHPSCPRVPGDERLVPVVNVSILVFWFRSTAPAIVGRQGQKGKGHIELALNR